MPPKLTRSRLAEIEEVLNASLFTLAAFEVESGKDGDVIRITYRDEPKFRARLYYYTPRRSVVDQIADAYGTARSVLYAEFCPGSFMETEGSEDPHFHYFLSELRNWTDRLRSEVLLVGTFQRQFREFQDLLNKKLEEHFTDATAHFAPKEREKVLEQLREFERRIQELEKSKEATENQVTELKKVVEDLAQAAATLPKRAWFRTACSKLYVLSSKVLSSPAGQKAIEATIDKLLPPAKGA